MKREDPFSLSLSLSLSLFPVAIFLYRRIIETVAGSSVNFLQLRK